MTPIIRADSAKAASVAAGLREQLLNLKIQVIDDNNMTQNHLGVKGKAVGRLVLFFIQITRKF